MIGKVAKLCSYLVLSQVWTCRYLTQAAWRERMETSPFAVFYPVPKTSSATCKGKVKTKHTKVRNLETFFYTSVIRVWETCTELAFLIKWLQSWKIKDRSDVRKSASGIPANILTCSSPRHQPEWFLLRMTISWPGDRFSCPVPEAAYAPVTWATSVTYKGNSSHYTHTHTWPNRTSGSR